MIPLIADIWHELWWHPDKARIWLRGFLGWSAATVAQVLAYPLEVVLGWSWKEWAARLAVSGVAGFALLIRAGEKNEPVAVPEVKG